MSEERSYLRPRLEGAVAGHLSDSLDPELLRLAHPIRAPRMFPNVIEGFLGVFGDEWHLLREHLLDTSLLQGAALNQTLQTRHCPRLLTFVRDISGNHYGGSAQGSLVAFLAWVRFALGVVPFFHVEDSLVEMLDRTDISRDVPLSMLRPPFPLTYIELGSARNLTQHVPNIDSGDHLLEGAYLEWGTGPMGRPTLLIIFTGSPIGKAGAGDDATLSFQLSLVDPDMPIDQAIDQEFSRARDETEAMGSRLLSPEVIPAVRESLRLLLKAVLYIGLPEARRELHPERTELRERLAGVKSAAKRSKLARRMERAHDRIVIKAPPPVREPAGEGSGGSGGLRASHWRRGHYRLQRFGAGYAQTRLIYVRPMLVGSVGRGTATPSQYEVR